MHWTTWLLKTRHSQVIDLLLLFVLVSEGKRASGLTAVWVARNRFAVLDRTHTVRVFTQIVMVTCFFRRNIEIVNLFFKTKIHSWITLSLLINS